MDVGKERIMKFENCVLKIVMDGFWPNIRVNVSRDQILSE